MIAYHATPVQALSSIISSGLSKNADADRWGHNTGDGVYLAFTFNGGVDFTTRNNPDSTPMAIVEIDLPDNIHLLADEDHLLYINNPPQLTEYATEFPELVSEFRVHNFQTYNDAVTFVIAFIDAHQIPPDSSFGSEQGGWGPTARFPSEISARAIRAIYLTLAVAEDLGITLPEESFDEEKECFKIWPANNPEAIALFSR